MPIASERPESGVRVQLERDKSLEDPPWIYEGAAHLPKVSFPVRVVVDAAGDVSVSIFPSRENTSDDEPIPSDLPEKVRLIVRTVYRQAKADNEPPAWRIVRWRAAAQTGANE